MSPNRLLPVVLALAITACASTAPSSMPTSAAAPKVRSIAVVCAPGGVDLKCFERASEFCRPNAYDLFDSDGRPATVADAQLRVVEARCRP
ncbi:hypothetical protein [Lysobacter claricitrinus]|uniref:hypothetical protein n=1 Tax=Lysobacter claricitrinus TaxID=3367728 RepID=UPI0037DB0932